MGFFKKKEVSAEEQEKRDAEKAEKERLRLIKKEERDKQNAIDSAARAEKKEAKKAAEKAHLERFFGTNPSFDDTMNIGIYNWAIERVRDNLLEENETVLATVPAEYDKSDKKEVKGVLVATDQKLVFSSNVMTKEYLEVMDYSSMSGISLENDGFLKKELHIVSGKEKRVFDDIKDDKQLQKLLTGVRKHISLARSGSSSQVVAAAPQPDKFDQLEKIAKLKEIGALTEEEFQSEKAKILAE
ncbi:PH domain-containing protein [Planococcus sp. A6]|uniref:PH domain-containing protein n=1 Tax=Planococcus sp. A6 TaxID=2992760 RepID=UPI00237A502E|nr:PH domain-containing protein [Planococcus sp. A6]MDE0581515.1 PH domain-containing protein [Planococcus sp. A6]